MNVLFLIHIEHDFRYLFPDEMFAWRLAHSVKAKKYDKVVILDSGLDSEGIIWEVNEARNGNSEIWDWSWGYEPEMFNMEWDENERNWCIPSDGHEWTWIPNELRDNLDYFRKAKVFIGGGYNSECLADWECVLNHLSIKFKRLEGLIY